MRILVFLFCLQSLYVYSQITKGGGGDSYHNPPREDISRFPREIWGDSDLTNYLNQKKELIKILNQQLTFCSPSYASSESLTDIYQHIQTRMVWGTVFRESPRVIYDCPQDPFSACLYSAKVKSKINVFVENKKNLKYMEIDLQDKRLAREIMAHFQKIVKDE